MKYNQPVGKSALAPYVDGNRNTGTRGDIPPGAAIEHDQRELVHLISFAGLTPDETDLEQVRKAIEALIAAATGGGDTSQFLLISQARARLPIFPDVQTGDGRIIVTSPGIGSILVPPTVGIQHRGIFPFSTSAYSEPDRTFATSASKTYHLRWTPADGFLLKDLADTGYNPGLQPETHIGFDSTYDNMLVARIVTNASNIAAITNLANKPRLRTMVEKTTTEVTASPLGPTGYTVNFARTPRAYLSEMDVSQASIPNFECIIGFSRTVNRYGGTALTLGFVPDNPAGQKYVRGTFTLELDA